MRFKNIKVRTCEDILEEAYRKNIKYYSPLELCDDLYKSFDRYYKEDIRRIFGKSIEAEIYNNSRSTNKTVKLNTNEFSEFERD